MKLIQSVFIALLATSLITSCGDKEEDSNGDLQLTISLEYDGEPMVMLQNYTYPTGETFYVTKVSMYLSDLAIGDQLLSDIEFINLADSHATEASAAEGFSLTYADLPGGEYPNLSFGLGVNATNNALSPGDFTSENPLSNAGEYWPGWQSFVFYKIEGQLDTDGDGNPDQGISLHCGGDEVYTVLTAQKPLSIGSDETATVQLIIDIKNVFDNNGEVYDIVANPGLHSKANHLPQMQTLVSNTAETMVVR